MVAGIVGDGARLRPTDGDELDVPRVLGDGEVVHGVRKAMAKLLVVTLALGSTETAVTVH